MTARKANTIEKVASAIMALDGSPTNKEIAEAAGVSVSSVSRHKKKAKELVEEVWLPHAQSQARQGAQNQNTQKAVEVHAGASLWEERMHTLLKCLVQENKLERARRTKGKETNLPRRSPVATTWNAPYGIERDRVLKKTGFTLTVLNAILQTCSLFEMRYNKRGLATIRYTGPVFATDCPV